MVEETQEEIGDDVAELAENYMQGEETLETESLERGTIVEEEEVKIPSREAIKSGSEEIATLASSLRLAKLIYSCILLKNNSIASVFQRMSQKYF